MRQVLRTAALLFCHGLSSLSAGCVEEQRYIVERERVVLPPSTAPAFFGENDTPIFVVSRRFSLPIRPPSELIERTLREAAVGLELPFPRLPWVEEKDLELQVEYVLENRSNQAVSAMVFLDGINEFFAYTPGPEDFHQYERRFLVEAGARVSGRISELQMAEVAIDLATAVNGAPNTALVVHPASQSGRDPRVAAYIPEVIPGLTGFRIGVETEGLGNGPEAPAPELVLRLSARAQDSGDKLTSRGETSWELPVPVAFVPVVPEENEP